MKKIYIFLLLIAFILPSCTTKKLSEKSMHIVPGMTKTEVTGILGKPGNRQFLEDDEAWQWCSTDIWGFSNDQYVIVWFYNDIVTGLNTYTNYGNLNCSGFYRSINWDDRPDRSMEHIHR